MTEIWYCSSCHSVLDYSGGLRRCTNSQCKFYNHKDPVNPTHYNGDSCMKAIEEVTQDLTGPEGFCTGNVIKYLWRWKKKNGIEDLKKARWYLDRLITYLEG